MTVKPARPRPRTRSWMLPAVAAGLALGSATTVWLGYRATAQWHQSTIVMIERTLEGDLALAYAAVTRDMRGAQRLVLTVSSEQLREETPHDLVQTCARLFAMYPYPESVFAWRRNAGAGPAMDVFNRAARPPPWLGDPPATTSFPVMHSGDVGPLGQVIVTTIAHAGSGKRIVAFESAILGTPYQVVARLDYECPGSAELASVLGFTVNLDWARITYFQELAEQVSRIGRGFAISVLDENGTMVGAAPRGLTGGSERSREIPLLFAEPALLPLLPPHDLPVRVWRIRVSTGEEGAPASVARPAIQTFVLICLAVTTMAGGGILTIRSVVARARLAALKSDLLLALTHEIKTPIASIQLASQTLVRGRYTGGDTVARYARLLLREASRLDRLVTNLLVFSGLADARLGYACGPLHVSDLVDDALESLEVQVDERGAQIAVNVCPDLPPVWGDRRAMLRVFENVIDNAVRYSADRPVVSIVATAASGEVHVWVRDNGPGIEGQDIATVFEKFARARKGRGSGTGLGLAVARRIVEDHGGRIELRSTPGEGSQVLIAIPVAMGAHSSCPSESLS